MSEGKGKGERGRGTRIDQSIRKYMFCTKRSVNIGLCVQEMSSRLLSKAPVSKSTSLQVYIKDL